MPNYEQQILNLLYQEKLLSQDQYQRLEQSRLNEEDFESFLISSKILDEEKLTEIKGRLLGLPYINLSGQNIAPDVLNILSEEISEIHKVIPFNLMGSELRIGMVNPRNIKAVEAMEFLAKENNFQVKYYIISKTSFSEAFKKYEVLGEEVEEALESAKEKFVSEDTKTVPLEIEEVIKRAPVSRMVSMIMKKAVESKASDIHIEPGLKESRVRFRIDGILHTALALPKYIHAAVAARVKVLANLKLDETRIPQDGRIREIINKKEVDFRISTLPLADQEKVVMRILETGIAAPSLKDLGFREGVIKILEKNIIKPFGMILITGPTGSGKSTTIYTLLSMLNKEGINIVTLEDPVEYFIPGVNQSQIRPEIDFTFAAGLRALLRQDPNIIMVGEIRDNETAELAVHASLTGHLIFSTLHTNDALGAVPRLIDMESEPFLLASTLALIVAQRLVRKICPYCKEVITLPPDLENEVREEIGRIPSEALPPSLDLNKPLIFYRGKGCLRCNHEGHKGRSVIAEAVEVTPELNKIIANGFKIDEVREEIKRQKMIFLKQDGILKALEGTTTVEEVMRVTKAQ